MTFLNLERLVPDMYKHSDRRCGILSARGSSRAMSAFDPRYKRIIYVVRDPSDVAISNYHWEMKTGSMGDSSPIEKFVPAGWMPSTGLALGRGESM